MFEKVLIPTDLSETSEKLVACANDIRNIREVVLLHIVRTGHTLVREREDVEEQQALITNPYIAVRCLIKEDPEHDIPPAILKTAETERPSLLIMGARKGRLSKILLGHDDIEAWPTAGPTSLSCVSPRRASRHSVPR